MYWISTQLPAGLNLKSEGLRSEGEDHRAGCDIYPGCFDFRAEVEEGRQYILRHEPVNDRWFLFHPEEK